MNSLINPNRSNLQLILHAALLHFHTKVNIFVISFKNMGLCILMIQFYPSMWLKTLLSPTEDQCPLKMHWSTVTVSTNTSLSQSIRGTFPCRSCEVWFLGHPYESYLTYWAKMESKTSCYMLDLSSTMYMHGLLRRQNTKPSVWRFWNILRQRKPFFRTIIGRHITFSHNYALHGFKFLPLIIPPHDWGGDWEKALLQAESRWIFKLHSDKTPGLIDAIAYAPFL